MRSVNIADLQARRSAHLRFVRDGEKVIVCDRNRPVARIIPCTHLEQPEQEQRLIARGLLTPPNQPCNLSSWPKPPGNVSEEVIEQLWREEREGR